ncbi:TraR/DksA family transcriptional regulator [Subtercola vilae]|nr:TraR/DksA family transcriptional regulator [Subtercola vilae]
MMLPDAQLLQLEQLLLAQRSSLDTELARLTMSLDGVRAARGDATDDDEHDPDGTPLSAEWSRIAGVHAELVERSDAVDRALARLRPPPDGSTPGTAYATSPSAPSGGSSGGGPSGIQSGTPYGTCAHCGGPIGFARLEALPTADLCITCAESATRRRRR